MYIPRKDWENIISGLKKHGQEHTLRFWDELSMESKEKLMDQLSRVDLDLLDELSKTHIENSEKEETDPEDGDYEPPEVIDRPKSDEEIVFRTRARKKGEELLSQGKVAVFIVAGGQGSRLGFKGPKGCFEITPIKKKTLFQLHAEKILAMQRKYQQDIPLYIMTSDTNHEETKEFFKKNDYFGLEEVHFFSQDMMPALDSYGKMILSNKDEIFMNPNGHGGSLYALRDSGALEDMKKKGIDIIFYMQVDNCLAKILDPLFIGYHNLSGAEMSNKAVKKSSPDEKVGVFGKHKGRDTVIEYSMLPDSLRYAKDEWGELKFNAGNIAIHCMNVSFIEKVCDNNLPFNKAFKKIPFLDENGDQVEPEEPNGYKFEMFIFDALGMCSKSVTMMVDRSKEFAPVKNKEGNDSPESARDMMSELHKNWLERCGIKMKHNTVVEISPLYALDAVELNKNIHYKNINNESHEIYLGD